MVRNLASFSSSLPSNAADLEGPVQAVNHSRQLVGQFFSGFVANRDQILKKRLPPGRPPLLWSAVRYDDPSSLITWTVIGDGSRFQSGADASTALRVFS
jgi:hypothetical protein